MSLGMWRQNIHYKVIDKAKRLVKNGQVELLDNGRYNVIGDHGTYNVVETPYGQMACNCPGYRDKGSCSHSMAVCIVIGKIKVR
ncbi:hypothetical protein MUP51_02125 [Candidatus Bathyarchaeota archaeon]|nr:hypothetical protein [Candidatus Bathyarchaeota archaeon]